MSTNNLIVWVVLSIWIIIYAHSEVRFGKYVDIFMDTICLNINVLTACNLMILKLVVLTNFHWVPSVIYAALGNMTRASNVNTLW